MKDTPQPCEILVTAAWLLPIAPTNEILTDYSMAISNGRIIDIGPNKRIEAHYRAEIRHVFDHHIVMPGLINAHGHAAMTLLRGAGEDQPLENWLQDTIWPMEARLVDESFVALGTELAIAEQLRSGTTTFSDMYFFPEQTARVSEQAGVRCQLAFPLIEFPNAWSAGIDDGIAKGSALVEQYRDNERVHLAFGPHSPYVVDLDNLQRIGDLAQQLDVPMQMHLHETATEVANARSAHGHSWIEVLHQVGLLNERLQAVHMTQITEAELELVAAAGTRVIHCPTSNLKLASGYCPISDLRRAGVCVALGTDGAASNNRLDLFDEARLASLLSKHMHGDAASGPAPDMVRMATLDGARALGLDHLIGSLEVGKQADFIAIDSHAFGMLPLYNPFGALLHGNAGNAVRHVFVAGRQLVAHGELTCIDAEALSNRVLAWFEGAR